MLLVVVVVLMMVVSMVLVSMVVGVRLVVGVGMAVDGGGGGGAGLGLGWRWGGVGGWDWAEIDGCGVRSGGGGVELDGAWRLVVGVEVGMAVGVRRRGAPVGLFRISSFILCGRGDCPACGWCNETHVRPAAEPPSRLRLSVFHVPYSTFRI